MTIKKTIYLDEMVARAAAQKARFMSGGNFSSYVNFLIYKDNEGEINRLIMEEEARKPQRTSDVLRAKFTSECSFCKGKINVGDVICSARFSDTHDVYVHKDCCRP